MSSFGRLAVFPNCRDEVTRTSSLAVHVDCCQVSAHFPTRRIDRNFIPNPLTRADWAIKANWIPGVLRGAHCGPYFFSRPFRFDLARGIDKNPKM